MSTADTNNDDIVVDDDAVLVDDTAPDSTDGPDGDEPVEKLSLEVKVDKPSACERHVTVVVPREDINRYMEREYDDLLPKAQVPGFRPGKAPRKLVVSRFKDQTIDQVKGKLLMDAMTQVSDEQDFSAISEPDLKFDAIVMPDDGDLTFEFTLEVRPEFDMPEWQGLTIAKQVNEVTDDDVRKQLVKLLDRWSTLEETDDPAVEGDYVTVDMTFSLDGKTLSTVEGKTLTVKPILSFRDAKLENFGELVTAAKRGDSKEFKITLSDEIDDEQLAGKEVDGSLKIKKVEHAVTPKLTPQFLDEIGGFEGEDDLMDAVREELERQNDYRQQQNIRQQITSQLTAAADLDLPQGLLRRQSRRELQRMVMELRSNGFSDEMVQAHSNQLQQNVLQHTQQALKEHFILERIAEDNDIDATPADFDREIERLAEQSGMSPRRVRARLEKQGEMDSLRNQIVERNVIALISEHAEVTETNVEAPVDDTAAIDHSVGGGADQQAIPEATHSEEAKPLPGTPQAGQTDHS